MEGSCPATGIGDADFEKNPYICNANDPAGATAPRGVPDSGTRMEPWSILAGTRSAGSILFYSLSVLVLHTIFSIIGFPGVDVAGRNAVSRVPGKNQRMKR